MDGSDDELLLVAVLLLGAALPLVAVLLLVPASVADEAGLTSEQAQPTATPPIAMVETTMRNVLLFMSAPRSILDAKKWCGLAADQTF